MQKLVIWPKEVTLVSRTEPSGPLCLWQRLNNYGTTYWSITPRPSTVSNVRFTFVYDLPCISIFGCYVDFKQWKRNFLPRKVQSAEPWHPYYEKCLSTFHLMLLHIFDLTYIYIQFGRQCFWLHCCRWYVACYLRTLMPKSFFTCFRWTWKRGRRQNVLMHMFQFLTASAKLGNKNQYHFFLTLKCTKFGIQNKYPSHSFSSSQILCTFLHLGQMILLPLLPWTFPLVTAQVHNGVHEDVGGGTSSEQ